MSIAKGLQTVSFPAGADLSAKQFHAVELASDGEVTAANAATDALVGILQDKPAAAARAASVGISGVTKVAMSSTAASGGIAQGSRLVANGVGKMVVFGGTNANHYVLGLSLTTMTTSTSSAGIGNQIGSMLITHQGFGSTSTL